MDATSGAAARQPLVQRDLETVDTAARAEYETYIAGRDDERIQIQREVDDYNRSQGTTIGAIFGGLVGFGLGMWAFSAITRPAGMGLWGGLTAAGAGVGALIGRAVGAGTTHGDDPRVDTSTWDEVDRWFDESAVPSERILERPAIYTASGVTAARLNGVADATIARYDHNGNGTIELRPTERLRDDERIATSNGGPITSRDQRAFSQFTFLEHAAGDDDVVTQPELAHELLRYVGARADRFNSASDDVDGTTVADHVRDDLMHVMTTLEREGPPITDSIYVRGGTVADIREEVDVRQRIVEPDIPV